MLHFMDSFAHYDISQINRKWLFVSGCTLVPGINGGTALAIGPIGQATLSLPARNFVVIGFRLKAERMSVSNILYQSGAIGLSRRNRTFLSLVVLLDGKLSLWAADSTLLGDSGDFIVHQDTWYYIEIKYSTSSSVDPVSGTLTAVITDATLRVDGTDRISAVSGSGVTGEESGWITTAGCVDNHIFSPLVSSFTGTEIQDLYIFDNTGPDNVDFAGDSHMGCIYPKADIDTDWIPNTGSNHFSRVKEHVADDDSSYIKAQEVGNHDEFDFDDVIAVGDINAAQYLICAKKDDEGIRSLRATMNSIEIGDEQFINDSYLYYRKPFDVSPPEDATAFNTRTWGVIVKR